MSIEEEITDKLKSVVDPHTGVSVYDMGLISELNIEDGVVSLTFTPTSPFCPLGIQLAVAIKKALVSIPEIKEANITVKGHIQEKDLNEMLKTME